jgi:hypothetical protein
MKGWAIGALLVTVLALVGCVVPKDAASEGAAQEAASIYQAESN